MFGDNFYGRRHHYNFKNIFGLEKKVVDRKKGVGVEEGTNYFERCFFLRRSWTYFSAVPHRLSFIKMSSFIAHVPYCIDIKSF